MQVLIGPVSSVGAPSLSFVSGGLEFREDRSVKLSFVQVTQEVVERS